MQITAEAGGARPTATTFVGRRDELARMRALLGTSRLLTITGPGGSGKTRLAEELVTQLARSFVGGIAVDHVRSPRVGITRAVDVPWRFVARR